MENHSPIIVLGCGFCGTSAVAKYLKDECAVFMGSRWVTTSAYDDADWHSVFRYQGKPITECVAELVIARQHYKRWGFRIVDSHLKVKVYLSCLDNPKFITCDRSSTELVDRMTNQWGMSKFQADYRIEEYRAICRTIKKFYSYLAIAQNDLQDSSVYEYSRIKDFVDEGD